MRSGRSVFSVAADSRSPLPLIIRGTAKGGNQMLTRIVRAITALAMSIGLAGAVVPSISQADIATSTAKKGQPTISISSSGQDVSPWTTTHLSR